MMMASMAKHWREALDVRRHVDHFHEGGARPRRVTGGVESAYFVEVVGFTFEFANVDQIRECLAFFEGRVARSPRRAVIESEKGWWHPWHERLPARVLHRSKRDRILEALAVAIGEFGGGATAQSSRSTT